MNLLILSEGQVPSVGAMVGALLGFAKAAKHVVVLGHTPTVVPSFINCLKGDSDISGCSGTLSTEDFTTVGEERDAASIVNDAFIDTTPWFCFQLRCPPMIDNVPAFADGSHISTAMAPRLIALLRASLYQISALQP